MGPILNLAGFQFIRGKMQVSLTPSIIATPKTRIRLGFIVKTQLQLTKILCQVIVLTGLPIHIHFANDLLQRNELSMHHNF